MNEQTFTMSRADPKNTLTNNGKPEQIEVHASYTR